MQVKAFLLLLAIAACPAQGLPAGPGEAAPEFTLPELNGGDSVALSEFTGKVVYVDFWASWCGPCRKSLPLYEEMKSGLAADRFRILAINLDEDREDAVRFLEKHPVSYTILLDPGGTSASQWQIRAMPSSFLLDANGTIVKAWAGFEPSHIEEIQNEINVLLN
jgi:thiol-disulfide isomerase/thioredoxin